MDFGPFGCTQLLTIIGFVITGAIAVGGFGTFERWRKQKLEEKKIRLVAAFSRITDPTVRRDIARLAGRIADHIQSRPMAQLLEFREPVDGPADNT